MLKYIGVPIYTPDVTDIAAKSNSTIEILWKTIDFKLPVFGPFLELPTTCYDKYLSVPMHINSV